MNIIWKPEKHEHVFFSSSLYLGNPMDPPDVLGMEPGIARPTKLPNRAKSTPVLFISLFIFNRVQNIYWTQSFFFYRPEQPPPRPPQPAVLLKSMSSSCLNL